jgi:outer membrane protein TolC
VLATQEQINVTKGDIQRLERSLQDTRHQYEAGVTDKIDHKRATIALNNTKAALKSYEEILKAKTEYLKSVAGYPSEQPLSIQYDTLQMEREIWLDTLAGPEINKRIEYQLLQTQKRLMESNLRYAKWSYLPTLSLGAAYNFNYLSNNFSDLYSINRPNSYVNLTLALPLFQGGKRRADIDQANLQLKRLEWDFDALDLGVNTQYQAALANYKGSLLQFEAIKENMDLAKEIYDVVNLQYRSGIKTYLEVVTAETDLRQARINYFNALYQVLSSKVDVQKALGQINI